MQRILAQATTEHVLDPAVYPHVGSSEVISLGGALSKLAQNRPVSEQGIRLEERLRERAHIARELHDKVLQTIQSAALRIESAWERLPRDSPERAVLTQCVSLIRQAVNESRGIVQGLRISPIAEVSLEQALWQIWDELLVDEALSFDVLVTGQARPLHPTIHEQVYLVARESLVNAVQHSQATKVTASIRYSSRHLRVIIEDNGRGIDPKKLLAGGSKEHWGLTGMSERAESIAGSVAICSQAGSGTKVQLSIPIS
jgi:signal transduction histidine kinase